MNLNSRNGLCQICRRTPQFAAVVLSFGAGIAAKAAQPAIGTTIGVQRQDYTFRPMQADGRADSFQNKLAVCFVFWGRQALGPSSNLDGVRIKHTDSLEELPKSQFEAVIETSDNGRVRMNSGSRMLSHIDAIRLGLYFTLIGGPPCVATRSFARAA